MPAGDGLLASRQGPESQVPDGMLGYHVILDRAVGSKINNRADIKINALILIALRFLL